LHRLNELGFDAEEVELISTGEGNKLRLKTRVAEAGHDSRQLFLRTGIDAGEHQARRLLNDIAGFRAWLEHTTQSDPTAHDGWRDSADIGGDI
jgi:hypothetical protein